MTTAVVYRAAFLLGVTAFASSVVGGAGYVWATRHRLPGLSPDALAAYHEHMRHGELRGAAREHRLASRIDPRSYGNSVELAQAMRLAGDAEGEIDQYRQARERWPLDPATHRALGSVYCRYRRFDEGIACLREALRLNPRDAVTHVVLAEAWLARGRTPEAVRSLSEAVRLDPRNAEAFNALGIAYAWSGEAGRAVEAFMEAVRLSPDPEYAANLERARGAAPAAAGRARP